MFLFIRLLQMNKYVYIIDTYINDRHKGFLHIQTAFASLACFWIVVGIPDRPGSQGEHATTKTKDPEVTVPTRALRCLVERQRPGFRLPWRYLHSRAAVASTLDSPMAAIDPSEVPPLLLHGYNNVVSIVFKRVHDLRRTRTWTRSSFSF